MLLFPVQTVKGSGIRIWTFSVPLQIMQSWFNIYANITGKRFIFAPERVHGILNSNYSKVKRYDLLYLVYVLFCHPLPLNLQNNGGQSSEFSGSPIFEFTCMDANKTDFLCSIKTEIIPKIWFWLITFYFQILVLLSVILLRPTLRVWSGLGEMQNVEMGRGGFRVNWNMRWDMWMSIPDPIILISIEQKNTRGSKKSMVVECPTKNVNTVSI